MFRLEPNHTLDQNAISTNIGAGSDKDLFNLANSGGQFAKTIINNKNKVDKIYWHFV
jgi:ribosomal protein L27